MYLIILLLEGKEKQFLNILENNRLSIGSPPNFDEKCAGMVTIYLIFMKYTSSCNRRCKCSWCNKTNKLDIHVDS